MNKHITLIVAIALGQFVIGQTQSEAIIKTMNERYEDAGTEFRQLLGKSGGSAELYFYAGDNYFYWDELDSARSMFANGVARHAGNPLNHAGLGRVEWRKGSASAAATHFGQAFLLISDKTSPLDKETRETALLKMAEECIAQKDLPQALSYLNKAIELNTGKKGVVAVTNPEVYLQFGDYYAEKDGFNLSNALAQYGKAYNLNPKYTRTLLRQGQLYVRVRNWDEGLKYFNQAIESDPSFAPAYREKAELLYRAGRFNQAIESYEKYLELNNSCRVQQRYASFIFLTNDYAKAVAEIERALPCNPDNLILYRLLGYGYYELGDYERAMKNLDRYFDMATTKDKSIISGADLGYQGKLLVKLGREEEGIERIAEAIRQDTSYLDGYSEIATIYSKLKNYEKAAEWYARKLEASAEKNPLDYYFLGQSRYFAKQYEAADHAFEQAAERYPDSWFWRAKSHNRMDDQENPAGIARPFYEIAIQKVGNDPKSIEANKKNLVEAYSYLGIIHGRDDRYDCSRAAWIKVLELDPENKVANDVMQDKDLSEAVGDCELLPAQ